MTFPENSHTKNITNELNFLLVTYVTHFDIRFGCYDILNHALVLDTLWTDWTIDVRSGFKATKWVRLAKVQIQLLK
jgi:hypothetical protein